ncbi:MAG: glycosyltransferase family 4 protein [Bacteroides sp.]|nr:glycosyltransferase family 4 protein [Bacteroides sp.]
MRILAPYGYFVPEQAASSYLWQNLHEDFAKNGLDCDVYTPVPTRGVTTEVRNEYSTSKKYEILYDGKLKIRRFSLWNEPKGTLMRFVRYFVQCGKLYFKLSYGKKEHYNVIFAASTPPIIGATCVMIKKRLQIPFIYNLQDIFPDSLLGTNITTHKGIVWKIGRVIENYTYRNADKIIVISEDFKRNIMAKGVPKDKIVVVYNWVDEEAVKHVPRMENILFDRYDLERSKFYITYSGNIGLTQNMDMLLEVAKELETNPDIQFVLIGEGAYKKRVQEIITEQNISNVTLLPFQPYEEISHVFSLGDVGLVISKPGVGENSVPSKTWSILSASRPVLANFDENELKTIVSENQCGIYTKAGDKEEFKQAILELYRDKERCQLLGRNGREFILKNLTRSVGTQKYVDVIKSFEKK